MSKSVQLEYGDRVHLATCVQDFTATCKNQLQDGV